MKVAHLVTAKLPALFSVLLGSLVFPSIALAHPGHLVEVVPASAPSHYLLQPEHAAFTLFVVATMAGTALWLRRKADAIQSQNASNLCRIVKDQRSRLS